MKTVTGSSKAISLDEAIKDAFEKIDTSGADIVRQFKIVTIYGEKGVDFAGRDHKILNVDIEVI